MSSDIPVPAATLRHAPSSVTPDRAAMPETNPKWIVEAMLFAASEPIAEQELQAVLPPDVDALAILRELQAEYAGRGVRVERSGRHWALRTAAACAPYLVRIVRPRRKLSRAALETLAVIAYRQPATRAEVEAVRGVTTVKGTIDVLMEAGWIAPRGRRDRPGRPVTWVTTPAFLDQFGIASLDDLPRLEELAAAGLFDAKDQG